MSLSNAIPSLLNALKNTRTIKSKIAGTSGSLTRQVFSTPGNIADYNLDNARGRIGLELTSLTQNIRALKATDPIAKAHPNIHYNLQELVAQRNWLSHEYGTTAPIKWDKVAVAVFDYVPVIEEALIAALKENGVPESEL